MKLDLRSADSRLESLDLGYRLGVHRHAERCFETILYATPEP